MNKSIPLLKKFFSDRKILICREMTKFFEEFIRADVDKLDECSFNLKVELTIVISENESLKNLSKKLNESDKRLIKKVIYNKVEIEYDVGPSLSRLSSQKISMNVEYQGCKENTYCYPIKSTVIFL